jgi:hypothetical protein
MQLGCHDLAVVSKLVQCQEGRSYIQKRNSIQSSSKKMETHKTEDKDTKPKTIIKRIFKNHELSK